MTYIPEDPPDENEAFEPLDESLDEEDLPGHGGGPEGERELDRDLITDRTALREVGADLDDPDRIALLDGGMDDPDGSGPPRDDELLPEEAPEGTDGEDVDPELEEIDTDATDLDGIADDAPGPDSARW